MSIVGNIRGPIGPPGQGFTGRGAWTASTAYLPYDVYTNAGSVYRVTTGYTSGATFGATDISNTNVWSTSGAAGAAGPTGPAGAAGASGSTWFTGAGVPSNAIGTNGDYYLNTTNGDVYQKAAGAW